MMRKTCVIVVLLLFPLFICACGRSNEKSEVEPRVKEEVKSVEKKVSGEANKLEEDYKVLEEEKDYKKALEEEPKPPASAMEEAQSGVNLE